MKDERWKMKDERWKMKDERWKMKDEKDERWKMKDERWKMKDERWKVKGERWKVKGERWKRKDERWKMKDERWMMNDEWWKIKDERWKMKVLLSFYLIAVGVTRRTTGCRSCRFRRRWIGWSVRCWWCCRWRWLRLLLIPPRFSLLVSLVSPHLGCRVIGRCRIGLERLNVVTKGT